MSTPLSIRPARRYLRHGLLPQIAAFEAVVRLGNAARAAESLCIAQPTLSGHLRKLTEALGVRLFEMQGKRLVPTAAALVLLQTTHEVFAAFERCEQRLASVRSRPSLDGFAGTTPHAPVNGEDDVGCHAPHAGPIDATRETAPGDAADGLRGA